MQDLLYNESFPEEWQCYIVARCQRTLDQGKISNRTMSTTIIYSLTFDLQNISQFNTEWCLKIK